MIIPELATSWAWSSDALKLTLATDAVTVASWPISISTKSS